MMRGLVLMVLILLFPACASGQETGVEKGGEAAAPPPEQDQPTQNRPEPQQGFRPFNPTDKVDADAAIPFPADI